MQRHYPLVLSLLALAIGSNAQTPLKPGDAAPPIHTGQVLQAPLEKIADWPDLGDNAIVLEFWGTWCGPCVAAIPHWNELAERFRDRPVRFLSITDEEDWRVRNFLKLRPLAGWIGLDAPRATFTAYGVEALPRTFIINRRHEIAAMTGPDRLTPELIQEALGGGIHTEPAGKHTSRPADTGSTLLEAVIRPARPDGGFKRNGTSITARGMALRQLISIAYNQPLNHVLVDSPMAETTYEVNVRVPEAAAGRFEALLQEAIGIACGVQVTRETRDMDVYILKTGSTSPKLRRVDGPEKVIMGDTAQLTSKGTYLKYFVSVLESKVGRPVVNETALDGLFDLALYWDAKDPQSVLSAVRDQLGLDLVPGRRPQEVLVVQPAPPAHP